MAKKKQTKKRKKVMSKNVSTPDFSVKQTAPKSLFGQSHGAVNGNASTSSMRSPGSQRKR